MPKQSILQRILSGCLSNKACIKEKRAEKKRISSEKASWTANRPINTDLMQFSAELEDWAQNKGERND